MIDHAPLSATTRARMLEDLAEIIDAIDRRVPRLESLGEVRIATEAAALRDKALARIAELRTSGE